jgi:hypothetical protein
MPLLYQHRIYRTDLTNNPKVLYVFGDNSKRVGMAGQAREMRGEPNAVGIATKWKPDMNPAAFFSDRLIEEQKRLFEGDIRPVMQALVAGRIVVWPSDGIGTGLSEVPERSPKMWAFMEEVRKRLEMI